MLYRAMFKASSPIGVLDRHPVSCIAVSDKYPLHRSGVEHPPLAGFPLYDRAARNERLGAWQGEMGVKWAEANPELLGYCGPAHA